MKLNRVIYICACGFLSIITNNAFAMNDNLNTSTRCSENSPMRQLTREELPIDTRIIIADEETYRFDIKLIELEPNLKKRLERILQGGNKVNDNVVDIKNSNTNEKPPKQVKLYNDITDINKKSKKKTGK